jgi:hypothetical protein
LTNTITVRGVEYPFISGEAALDPATKIIWSLLKISSPKAYESALLTRDPVSAFQALNLGTDNSELSSLLLYSLNLDTEIESDPVKNPRVALEKNLRKLIPSLPEGLGATELIEFINAVLPDKEEPTEVTPEMIAVAEYVEQLDEKLAQVIDLARNVVESEEPTLEEIVGREVSPEELTALEIEGKPLEDAIAAPLIPISDTELAKLGVDLVTIDEEAIQLALAEQRANRLTVVSSPAPTDIDELEDTL